MSGANLHIKMSSHGRGEVFLNGQKVEGVKAVTMAAGVNEVNTVQLTIAPSAIEIEGVFDVSTIESDMREYKVDHED